MTDTKHTLEKKQHLQQKVLGKLSVHLQRNEMKLDLAENSLRQDKALSVKAETQRLPEEKAGSAL